ncbi:hypothetical protein TYRP_009610 [Tyrophagus putrescentiae]|nr:hypothetical protein TYRP_009610 [Tyrophagus putrescentiae]
MARTGPINLPYRCTITAKKEDKIAKQGCKMRLKEDLLKGPLLEICRKQPIYALDPPRTRSRVKQDSSGDQAGNEVAEAARTTTMKATGVTKAFHKVKMMKVRPKGANGSIEKELIPAPKDAKEKDVNSYEVTKDNNSSRNNNNNNNNEKVKVGRSGLRNGNDKISSDNGKDVKKSRKRKANPSFLNKKVFLFRG